MRKTPFLLAALLFTSLCPCASPPAARAGGEGAGGEGVDLPVLMYHSVLNNPDGGKFRISPAEFERDLIDLRDGGYSTIFPSEAAAYVLYGAALPEKPVMLTFDDGYYNNYANVLPLLQKYGMKAVVSVIGKDSDIWSGEASTHMRDGHLTWAHIAEMRASGLVEIGNHTYGLHAWGARRGCARKQGEDAASYRKLLKDDVGRLQEKLYEAAGVKPVCFAYPYGCVSPEAAQPLEELGLSVTLGVRSGVNRLTPGQPECLLELCRCNRAPGKPAKVILKNLREEQAKTRSDL